MEPLAGGQSPAQPWEQLGMAQPSLDGSAGLTATLHRVLVMAHLPCSSQVCVCHVYHSCGTFTLEHALLPGRGGIPEPTHRRQETSLVTLCTLKHQVVQDRDTDFLSKQNKQKKTFLENIIFLSSKQDKTK